MQYFGERFGSVQDSLSPKRTQEKETRRERMGNAPAFFVRHPASISTVPVLSRSLLESQNLFGLKADDFVFTVYLLAFQKERFRLFNGT
ncbi:hypothetical protein Trydic_g7009 [Trypoxylus dichotomus]